jgi:hypothetical protein
LRKKEHWGWRIARVSLLVSCSAAWPAMEVMSRWYERQRETRPASAADRDRSQAGTRAD